MSEIGEPRAPETDGWPWVRLFRCATADAALAEITRWLGLTPDVVLELRGGPNTSFGREADDFLERTPSEIILCSRDGWRLVARTATGTVPPVEPLERAAIAFQAWQAAQSERSKAESRLSSKARDLETLHALSRRLSEANRLDALIEFAASALHERAGVEAVGWAHRFTGPSRVELFRGRPLGESAVDRIVSRAGRTLGWGEAERPTLRALDLDGCAEGHGARAVVSDDELLVIPLERRASSVAALIVLFPDVPSEPSLRFTYGTANHLALHLDRLLSVHENEQGRFRSILDSMPQAVVLLDRDLNVLQGNAAARAMLDALGADPRASLGRVVDLDLGVLACDALSPSGSTASSERKLADGRTLALTLSPFGGLGGRADGLVLVMADVTESRRLLDSLAQAERLSSLGRMLSGVAHELNNPLASVLGFAQLARTAPRNDKLDRRLEVIHEEAQRCQKIVQNLLRFARRHEPERQPLSLNETIEASVALVGYQLRVDGIEVVLELDPHIPSIHGDAHEIRQVLVNLITNAHQAIRQTGRPGRITLRTTRIGADRVALEVRDDGPGIPDAIRAKVFDPFFTTKAEGQGTGLGLSLAYAAVTAHGGRIELAGPPGEGTVMSIELPVGAPDPARSARAASQPRHGAFRVSARILVVDDERPLASMICETLETDGHLAVPACEADEVISRLTEGGFDLVVSDLKMPGLGAERLYDAVARLRPGLEKRLVLTTGDTVSREPEALASRIGAELLHKPFALDELRRIVRVSLEAARRP